MALPVPATRGRRQGQFDETLLRGGAREEGDAEGGRLLVGTAAIRSREPGEPSRGARAGNIVAYVGESGEGGAEAAAKCILELGGRPGDARVGPGGPVLGSRCRAAATPTS